MSNRVPLNLTMRVTLLHVCLVAAVALAGCARHYVNQPITNPKANQAYHLTNPDLGGVTDDIHFVLAFSGGGTRAASMSYGILKTLAQTKVRSAQGETRLLDEVDIISSVSGGSYTAAYYGLYGDRLFEDFEQKFLKVDFEGKLKQRLISPAYWPKYASRQYGRSEMSAGLLDKLLFEGKRYRDLIQPGRPLIDIQTTDAVLGEGFAFNSSEFKLICSDLLDFPVSRAVVASSAVPLIFNTVIINNYGGQCGYKTPEWIQSALTNNDWDSRVDQEAVRIHSYLNSDQRPYLHLMDGGLADNLGVRSYMNRLFTRGEDEDSIDIDSGDPFPRGYILDDDEAALVRHGLDDVKKVAYIIVNAEVNPGNHWDKKNRNINLKDTVNIATSVGMSRYNFATIKFIERRLKEWKLEMMEEHCPYYRSSHTDEDLPELSRRCPEIDTYLVYLDFNLVNDEQERSYFQSMPTSFVLEEKQVDNLIRISNTLLTHSKEYQRFVKSIN